MTSLVVISAGMSVPSTTRLLADRIAGAADAALGGADVTHIELRGLASQITERMLAGFARPELERAYEAVAGADALIVVTPVFAGSYSGLFKSFFDMLEEGTLDGKVVLIAATAGTPRHSLVLDHALRPLFSYLHALVVPTGVFAATDDFGDTSAGPLDARIRRAARELAGLVMVDAQPAQGGPRWTVAPGAAGGQQASGGRQTDGGPRGAVALPASGGQPDSAPARRRSVAEEFTDPTPFSVLLRQVSAGA